MATQRVKTSSRNKKQAPKGLPASEEPVGHGSKSIAPPKEGGSGPVRSSRRSSQIKSYKPKERRVTFHGETGLAKHLKRHARDRRFRCGICQKSFSKKSRLSIHQWSHSTSKCLAGLGYGTGFVQRAQLPICTIAHLLKATKKVKCHMRKHRKEAMYACQKCMKMFFLHENFIKHQKIHLPPGPGQPQADPTGKPEEAGKDHSELFLEELTKLRQNFDQLLLNQQLQLQVLQGIQRQVDLLRPGNYPVNSNVCSHGLMLSQQSAAVRIPCFLNAWNPLPQMPPHSSS